MTKATLGSNYKKYYIPVNINYVYAQSKKDCLSGKICNQNMSHENLRILQINPYIHPLTTRILLKGDGMLGPYPNLLLYLSKGYKEHYKISW